MKNIFRTAMLFVVAFIFISEAQAQQPKKPRASLNASVSQTIGIDTEISINYSRPGVKGRKIWGDIVPFGYSPGNKYSNEKPFPWRGGANENTTISFSKDVLVEGNKVPAGKYSLHFIPSENDWVVIINKNNTLWGSYLVNPDEDALRVTVKTSKAHFQEWLLYGFDNLSATSATAFLHWEELKVPFNISVVE
ncbi:MAG: DUF2911 domain-containing protein [Melioribacteraceae bacterium]|nr:DUF2911 domain-containing protein [Melioribacteraceae bacterium]